MLQDEPFDNLQHEYFGNYIYALIDPRDGKIFYIGQASQSSGPQARIGGHYAEARDVIKGGNQPTDKRQRIIDIWSSGHEVEAHIVRYGLRDKKELDHVEGALIQSLLRNGTKLTNAINAPGRNNFGWQTPRDILDRKAKPVAPHDAFKRIHVFNITNGLQATNDQIEAVRRTWYSRNKVNPPKTGIAVGTAGNPAISRVVCRIDKWYRDKELPEKWAFDPQKLAPNIIDQLNERNWSKIIDAVGNARQWGNPIQVEFDGRDQFKILSGGGHLRWRKLNDG